MDFEKIINSPLINKAELARLLWPDVSGAKVRFANKLKNVSGQRFTDKDKIRIVSIVEKELTIPP